MKKIILHNSTLELPDKWEDLSHEQMIYTFEILSLLFLGQITPDTARLKMLINYTGYKPSQKMLFKEALRKNKEQRETINFNLLRLSEQLTFAFKVEDDKIVPNYLFRTNPIPFLTIEDIRYAGRKFELDITSKTDISAREFSDCFDLLSSLANLDEESQKEECINQICSILYPSEDSYEKNLVSGHNRRMNLVESAIKFGIIFWFTGIVNFYTKIHPNYSILFNRERKQGVSEKLSLGMNEITLELQKEGHGDPDDMNLNDYFDAQIIYLKKSIHNALKEGVKPEIISSKTGIPLTTIQRLS